MNIEKLYQFFLSNQYTDLSLIIKDDEGNTPVILNVHRNILAASSEYFHKLFINNTINANQMEITVPNNLVAKDVILSFYGHYHRSPTTYGAWHRWLMEFICKKLFEIEHDIPKSRINIPSEGFLTLVSVIEKYIGLQRKVVSFINSKLRYDGDLSLISDFVIERMIENCYSSRLAILYDCGDLITWDLDAIEIIYPGANEFSQIKCFSTSPNSKIIAMGNRNASCLEIYSSEGAETQLKYSLDGVEACSLCYISSDYLAVGCTDGSIKIANIFRRCFVLVFQAHISAVTHISSINGILVSVSRNTIKIWDLSESLLLFDDPKFSRLSSLSLRDMNFQDRKKLNDLREHAEDIVCIACTNDGEYLASADPKKIVIWSIKSGQMVNSIQERSDKLYKQVCYSPCNRFLASSDSGHEIKIWDSIKGVTLQTIETKVVINRLFYHRSGEYLISIGADNYVRIWDTKDGKLTNTMGTAGKNIVDVTSSYCWDLETLKKIKYALSPEQRERFKSKLSQISISSSIDEKIEKYRYK